MIKLRILVLGILFLALIQNVLGADAYKPYLHNPSIPQHPDIKLYGEYNTLLYAGASTYSYSIDVPKGINGMQPKLSINYNSQSAKQRTIIGSGWYINQDYIYRDINSTLSDSSDDRFFMYLNGNYYELVLQDGIYHTKVDYYYRIQYYGPYWIVTLQDGTQYRFGYSENTTLTADNGLYTI